MRQSNVKRVQQFSIALRSTELCFASYFVRVTELLQYQVTVVGTQPNGQKSPPSAALDMTTPQAGCVGLPACLHVQAEERRAG